METLLENYKTWRTSFLLQQFAGLMLNSDENNINKMLSRFRGALRSEMQDVLSRFGPEEEDEDMFAYLWSLEAAHIHLKPHFPSHEKSGVRAKNLQEEGLVSSCRGDHQSALIKFNQAVSNAPSPGQVAATGGGGGACAQGSRPDQTLAACYASRSEILFRLLFFDHCLKDIERAVQAGHSRKAELAKRKKKCLQAIDRETDLPFVREAVRFRGRPTKETFHERFKLYQQSQLGGLCLSEGFRKSLLTEEEIPKCSLSEPHPTIPTMSSAVTLAYTPAKGRHILAARDIFPGELLFLENNFSSSLSVESYKTRCLTCASQCCASLPCPNCCFVMFCSEECREQGLADFHKQECEILPALASFSDDAPTTLVFRILMKLTFPRLKELLPILKHEEETLPPEKRGFNEDGIYDAEDFRVIYHLCTNKHQLSSLSILGTCTVAFVVTKILIASKKYFVDGHGNPISPSEEDIALVGGTLVRILMAVDTNSFCLKELQVSYNRNRDVCKTDVGMKLCSTLSLLNHSCNPSVYSSTGSGTSTSRAIRFIPAGQEVTTCYGITYYDLEKSERWGRLKEYHFTCCCEACENNWPRKGELPSKLLMKCLGCSKPVSCSSGKCTKCDKDEGGSGNGDGSNLRKRNQEIGKQISDAMKNYHHVRNSERFLDRNDEKDIEVISKVIELMDKYVVLPCKFYYDAQQALQIYYNRERKFTYVTSGSENMLSNYYWAPLP